jgi:CRISPR-associated protein Csb1
VNTNFAALEDVPRLLLEADLWPVQGDRFQPTGFPDLGPAEYQLADGTRMLLVESTQSMANRLEAVCWDFAADPQRVVPELEGMPYVRVITDRLGVSSSILEFHRLNSPYIMADQDFKARLASELGLAEQARDGDVPGALDLRRLASVVFKYDPGSVLHGVFLEKLAGRLRIPRMLSAFIEARSVQPVESGGVKFDHLDPTGKIGGGANEGFGNVPHHRVEFTAERITAYFNVDLAGLRSYGLGDSARQFLIALALWKIRTFLETGLRLRTACDFEAQGDLRVTRPGGFSVPERSALAADLKELIQECAPFFASPPVTDVRFGVGKKN